jgi:hypothetical protein
LSSAIFFKRLNIKPPRLLANNKCTPPEQSQRRFIKVENTDALSNGSVTAGESLGGVRPSSGAATLESLANAVSSGASSYSALAAAEDGRTPSASLPPSLTHYCLEAISIDIKLVSEMLSKQVYGRIK